MRRDRLPPSGSAGLRSCSGPPPQQKRVHASSVQGLHRWVERRDLRAARHRAFVSVAVVEHTIGLPVALTPVAPPGERTLQASPPWAWWQGCSATSCACVRRYPDRVDEDRELITAEMLDRMSPSERAQAFNARIITDLEQLPTHFRDEVVQHAQRLAEERRRPTAR